MGEQAPPIPFLGPPRGPLSAQQKPLRYSWGLQTQQQSTRDLLTVPSQGAGPRFCSQEGSRATTGGNPAGTRPRASPGTEGHSHTWPDRPQGSQFPIASVNWSEKWDQHTQAKEVSSRKLEMKHPIPLLLAPEDRGSTRTFLGACQPHPTPSTFGRDPIPLLSGPKPSHLPSESTFWGSGHRGTAGRLQVGGVCVGGALWLEAKAILAGSGPVCSA